MPFVPSVLRRPVSRELGDVRAAVTFLLVMGAAAAAVPKLHALASDAELRAMQWVVADRARAALHTAGRIPKRLRICASDDGVFCGGAGWQQGWIAFDDADGNGQRSPRERVVYRQGALPLEFMVAGDPGAGSLALCRRDAKRPLCTSPVALSDESRPPRS